MLAERVADLKPSPTLAISAKAKAMGAAGAPVISLAAGEPDLPTPEFVIAAANAALAHGATRYTPVKGTASLRNAVAVDASDGRAMAWDPDREILVTVGAKQALFNLFQALLNPGDEVLLPIPSWVSYGPQVALAGGNPVAVDARPEDGFFPTVATLEAARTAKTRALVWTSPSNPTGMVASRDQVAQMAAWARQNRVMVISDEIYRRILFSDAPATASPADLLAKDEVVVIDGVSKSHCMTGWRIGWALGPAALIAAMTKIQSHQTSNPTAVSQEAAEAALRGGEQHVAQLAKVLEGRRDRFVARLQGIDGLTVLRPQGAFYVFVGVEALLRDGEDDLSFCDALLEAEAVAAVPGTAFGSPGWLRMSITLAHSDLDEAADRLARFVDGRR